MMITTITTHRTTPFTGTVPFTGTAPFRGITGLFGTPVRVR
ncbi:hypothetical protein [Curtobacterium sp. NPDC089689]